MGMALLIIVILFPLFSRFFNPIPGFSWRNIRMNICINTFLDIFLVLLPSLRGNRQLGLIATPPWNCTHSHPWGYVTHARTHEASHAFRYEVRASFLFGNQPPGKNQFRLGAPTSNRTTEESGVFCFWFGALLLGKKIKMESNKTAKHRLDSVVQCCTSVYGWLFHHMTLTNVFWPRPLNKIIVELWGFLDNE